MADDGVTLDRAIRDMLVSASQRKPLSLRHCVDGIRGTLPDCDLTDGELGDLIATLAISRGFQTVAFDISTTVPPSES